MVAPMEENELVSQTKKFCDREELDCSWQMASVTLTHPGLLWLLLQPGLWPMDFGLCLPPLLLLSCSQGESL